MSPSTETRSAEARLLSLAAALREAPAVSPDVLRAIVSASAQAYSAACEAAGEELCPLDSDIPTTEAMRLACALVRSRNLNPFDFALWFSSRG